jgi:hypothetical protein
MTRFRSARVLLAIGVLAALPIGALVASARTASNMASAANKFLASLTPEERQQAALPLGGGGATHWHFIPNEMFPRKGLQMKAMTEAQRTLAHDLLKTGLSQRGYATATAIMALEDVLREMESAAGDPNAGGRRFARNPLEYYVTVFGTPSAKGAWGWRVEGHHVSLHFMVNDGTLVASSPTFFGSNPAEVRGGPKKGTRILGAQEDAAYALLTALTDEQKKTAILQNVAPNDIVTMNKVAVDPLSPVGITAADMTPAQRDLLMKLIDVYAGYMTADLAAERTAKLQKAGVDKIAFAWAGPVEKGQKHYYRIQGPTFLVELDNSQNDGNHIHSVWRDFNGDFGRDVLREHIAAFHHH